MYLKRAISLFSFFISFAVMFLALAAHAEATTIITIDAGRPGAVISSNLF